MSKDVLFLRPRRSVCCSVQVFLYCNDDSLYKLLLDDPRGSFCFQPVSIGWRSEIDFYYYSLMNSLVLVRGPTCGWAGLAPPLCSCKHLYVSEMLMLGFRWSPLCRAPLKSSRLFCCHLMELCSKSKRTPKMSEQREKGGEQA